VATAEEEEEEAIKNALGEVKDDKTTSWKDPIRHHQCFTMLHDS
jgi:hypothetical protein